MKIFSLLMISIFILMLSTAGCSTSKGVGEDIEKVGKSIQKAANKNN